MADWHGAYSPEPQHDPVGPDDGIFRGTRGGSHSTEPYYLRTANRAGALPDEQSWYIGFRVAADGAASRVSATRAESPATKKNDDAEKRVDNSTSWPKWDTQPMAPVVRRYVNWPGNGSQLPFSDHNHEPTIAACPDGSVYANWYSTNCGEPARCTVLLVSTQLSLALFCSLRSPR